MADKEITNLPAADAVTDETLIPVYQPGSQTPAQSMTGAQFRAFAEQKAKEFLDENKDDLLRGPEGPQGPAGPQGEPGTTSWHGLDDKPVNIIRTTVFPEQEIEAETAGDGTGVCVLGDAFVPVAGKTYIVRWGDKEYECVAQSTGDNSAMLSDTGTYEDFAFLFQNYCNTTELILPFPGIYVFAVELVTEQFDKSYLPDPSWKDMTDKPIYEDAEIIVPETEINTVADMTGVPSDAIVTDAVLYAGENYVVTCDGVEYECTAFEDGSICLGNESVTNSSLEDTGEPFFMYKHSGQITVYTKTSGNHTIKVQKGKRVTIDDMQPETWTFTLEDGTTVEKRVMIV